MTADEFYRLRDSRSRSYLRNTDLSPRPIAVEWDRQTAEAPAGQTLILALVNQLTRFCRNASFVGPDAERKVPSLCGVASLNESVFALANAIDPYGSWLSTHFGEPCIRIAIGGVERGDLFVAAAGWTAHLSTEPLSGVQWSGADVPGAAAASCLAAANAFKASLDLAGSRFAGSFSLWSMDTDDTVDTPVFVPGAQLGTVLMAGAGAVASATAYWMRIMDLRAHTDIVDRDLVDLPNTNRAPLFTAANASERSQKARVVASWLGDATAHERWYDEFDRAARWDVYLPLANDRNARSLMQSDCPPVMLHATTSEDWQTFLHRHRPGRDQCIACRFPGDIPVTDCAEGKGETVSGEPQEDAALPFMSSAAGLTLAADLYRLATGHLTDERNLIILDWKNAIRARPMIARCERTCRRWETPDARRALNVSTRWYDVDGASNST